ncbi:hypothetical protein [Streptomyces sp. FIT100]|uniref:hypothetical protein n=1 Tax=Streptomyces sp. FIT100 TaxID=2837956 RepID=UPI0021C8FE6C|nr:hypothetical protein [Streptomyces sp. FIT100]UUN30924.1 hypothetical protein KK483_34780 [Streptomyces sp. FIT100]
MNTTPNDDKWFWVSSLPPKGDITATTKKVTLNFDFALRNRSVNEVIVSLPVGSTATDLVSAKDCGYIEFTVGSDNNPVDNSPWWKATSNIKSNAYEVTLKARDGHKTDRLLLTLSDVNMNDAPGTATITAKLSDGTHQSVTVEKQQSDGKPRIKSFTATGQMATTQTKYVKNHPIHLDWNATDITESRLTLSGGPLGTKELPSTQRSYPENGIPNALTLTEDTTFNLNATSAEGKSLSLEVAGADYQFSNLTVTHNLTVTENIVHTQEYWLNEPLTLTAEADGYYTINLTTYRRLLGVFPPTIGGSPTPNTIKIVTPNNGQGLTFHKGSTNTPFTIFTPKGSTITITSSSLVTVDDWTKLAKATITWTGPEPTTMPPSNTPPYDKFSMAKELPFYFDGGVFDEIKTEPREYVTKELHEANLIRISSDYRGRFNDYCAVQTNFRWYDHLSCVVGRAVWLSSKRRASMVFLGGSPSDVDYIRETATVDEDIRELSLPQFLPIKSKMPTKCDLSKVAYEWHMKSESEGEVFDDNGAVRGDGSMTNVEIEIPRNDDVVLSVGVPGASRVYAAKVSPQDGSTKVSKVPLKSIYGTRYAGVSYYFECNKDFTNPWIFGGFEKASVSEPGKANPLGVISGDRFELKDGDIDVSDSKITVKGQPLSWEEGTELVLLRTRLGFKNLFLTKDGIFANGELQTNPDD